MPRRRRSRRFARSPAGSCLWFRPSNKKASDVDRDLDVGGLDQDIGDTAGLQQAALRGCPPSNRRVSPEGHPRLLFRVKVLSSDEQPVAVTIQVDTHRKTPSVAAMNDIADRLRINHDEIDHVLATWTPEELRQHLAAQTKAELLSRAPLKRS